MSHTHALPQPSARLSEFVLHFVHGSLLSIGLVAILIAGSAYLAGELPLALRNILGNEVISAAATAEAAESVGVVPEAPTVAAPVSAPVLAQKLNATAEVIAKRYRVALPAVTDVVRAAHQHARSAGFDPMLVLAMIAVESRFNPVAESSFGAQGLMQIIGRFHTDKFKPTPDGTALLDPETNIRVGVAILREYLARTGDLATALRIYGGETEDSGLGYADRVMAEKERLEAAIKRAAP